MENAVFGHSVFYRPAFASFLRLFCKIANLQDIDLKFAGSISDSNIDNPAKFREVSLEVAFLKMRFFGILVCNLQTSQVMSTFFSDFVPPY